jgi:hypothetical protein
MLQLPQNVLLHEVWGARGEAPTVWRPAPVGAPMTVEEKRDDMINWIKAQRPVNTSNSYKTYDKQFKAWCNKNGET